MGFWKGFGIGIGTFFKAIGFVFSKGLWWSLLFPIAINVLFIWGGSELITLLSFKIENFILSQISINSQEWYSDIVKGLITGSVWLILKILFFSIFVYFGGYIILAVMSPVFSYLSEKTEKIITGKTYPFSGQQLMRDVVRGILITLRNMFYELLIILIIFLSSFIPVLGWVFTIFGSIILFFVSSYFYGFSFIDYTSERRKLNIKQSVKFVRKNKGLALSSGLIFALAMLIPFCGTLIAPFVSIFSVVGATIAILKIKQND